MIQGVSLQHFTHTMEVQPVLAGHVIFAAGQSSKVMYLIKEGEVDLRVGDRILATVGPGAPIGILALLDRTPEMTSAVAKTDCKLVPIEQKQFLFLVKRAPYFAVEVMKTLVSYLQLTLKDVAGTSTQALNK